MRKSAKLTTITLLFGGCTVISPPRQPPSEAVPVHVEPQAVAEASTPQQQAAPPRAAPRQPQAVRIDNTSIESFRTSWQRMHASLSPAQQTDLRNAVAHLTFADYGGLTNVPPNLRSSPIVPEMVRDKLAGLTFAEIVALAP